jgi:hypothetical protein
VDLLLDDDDLWRLASRARSRCVSMICALVRRLVIVDCRRSLYVVVLIVSLWAMEVYFLMS